MRNIGVEEYPAACKKIFSRPFRVKRCLDSPELADVYSFPPSNIPHQRRITVRELGVKPEDFIIDTRYDHIPRPYLYQLENVPVHGCSAFAQDGSLFWETVRIRPQDSAELTFTPGHAYLTSLGNGYLIPSRPRSCTYSHITDPCMLFHTIPAYGHYLLESISLLWVLQHGFRPKLLLPSSSRQIPAYLLDMVAPFGLAEEDFIIPGEFVLCDRLLVSWRPIMLNAYMGHEAHDIYRKISLRYADTEQQGLRLYVSREQFGSRKLLNEKDCESLFREYGFIPVYPEKLSFAEQVSLFAKATHIAGPISSGLHNILFSLDPQNVKFLPLVPRGFPAHIIFWVIENFYQRKAACVFGSYTEAGSMNRYAGYFGSWTMDLNNLKTAIDQWLNL